MNIFHLLKIYSQCYKREAIHRCKKTQNIYIYMNGKKKKNEEENDEPTDAFTMDFSVQFLRELKTHQHLST